MYFPFFQKEHKVHHHILSAGLFALVGLHAFLGVDALLAGPTSIEKSEKVIKIERKTQGYKDIARQARLLILSSKKVGKTLTFAEAINMVKNGTHKGGNSRTAMMTSTVSGERQVIKEEMVTFSSAPEESTIAESEIYASRITTGSKGRPKTTTTSSGTTSSGTTTSSGSTSSGTTTTTSSGTTNSGTINSGTTTNTNTGTPSPTGNAINLIGAENPQLQKLADYQKIVGGFVTDQLMVFVHMPESSANIEGTSYYIANTANEFARYGVTPIFVIEPFGDNGVQLDLGKIKNGDYSAKLDQLFSLLKNARGLTEDKLGLLVPYPEINTPAFNRANFVPTDLPILVNQYFDTVKKYYPNVRGGLLLDGKSYDIGKTWGQGEYKSFSPYISGIKPGYISTFGVQGFPWVSNDGSIKSYNPTVFLPINLAKEGADLLGTKNIWFNTGTMKRSYTSNTVYTSAEERETMMNGIIAQGKSLQSSGYTPMIHIFAQNKFSTGEGIDWSYIESANDGVVGAHEGVFSSFINQSRSSGIKTGLFDR